MTSHQVRRHMIVVAVRGQTRQFAWKGYHIQWCIYTLKPRLFRLPRACSNLRPFDRTNGLHKETGAQSDFGYVASLDFFRSQAR